MNPRNTGILFIVAVLVVGGVWWSENVRKEQVADAEAQAQRLFPEVDAADIQWLALKTTDGHEARVERRDGVFRLVEPLDFAVDRTILDGVAAALAETKSEATLSSSGDPEIYGLGDAADGVRFGSDDEEYALTLGGKTPVGSTPMPCGRGTTRSSRSRPSGQPPFAGASTTCATSGSCASTGMRWTGPSFVGVRGPSP